MRSIRHDLERLERELQTSAYQVLLNDLRLRTPFHCDVEDWAEVLLSYRPRSKNDPDKERLLRAIFEARTTDLDPRWNSVLLGLFWFDLESIDRRKRRWNSDSRERWHILQWCFLKAISRIDLTRRPDRLAQKILNDTAHFLYDECKADWDRAKRERPEEPEVIETLSSGQDAIEFAQVDLRRSQDEQTRRFHRLLNENQISEADCFLLMATHIYGQSVREYADSVGVPYETAKKRHQRAEARLRSLEEST